MRKPNFPFSGLLWLLCNALFFNTEIYAAVENNQQLIPFKQDQTDYAGVWLIIGVFLTVVVAVGYAANRYFTRGLSRQRLAGKSIEVIESRRLSPKTSLYLVRIETQRLLIVESGEKAEIMNLDGGERQKQPESKC